jgi:hypothetical protein
MYDRVLSDDIVVGPNIRSQRNRHANALPQARFIFNMPDFRVTETRSLWNAL